MSRCFVIFCVLLGFNIAMGQDKARELPLRNPNKEAEQGYWLHLKIEYGIFENYWASCSLLRNDSIVKAEWVQNIPRNFYWFGRSTEEDATFQEIEFGPLQSGDYSLFFKDYDFVYKPYSISLRNESKVELHVEYVEISEYIRDTLSVAFASFQGLPVFFANVEESKNYASFQYRAHQKYYYENHLIENPFLVKPKDHSFTYNTVKTYSYLKEKRRERILKAYIKDKIEEDSYKVLPIKKGVKKKRNNPYSISKRYRARYNR